MNFARETPTIIDIIKRHFLELVMARKGRKERQKRSKENDYACSKVENRWSRSLWLYIHHGAWCDGRNFCGYLILRFFPNRKNSQNIVPANNSNNKVFVICVSFRRVCCWQLSTGTRAFRERSWWSPAERRPAWRSEVRLPCLDCGHVKTSAKHRSVQQHVCTVGQDSFPYAPQFVSWHVICLCIYAQRQSHCFFSEDRKFTFWPTPSSTPPMCTLFTCMGVGAFVYFFPQFLALRHEMRTTRK